jgi:hypothetical protein
VLLETQVRIFAQADIATRLFVSQHIDAVIRHRKKLVAGAGFEPAAFRL